MIHRILKKSLLKGSLLLLTGCMLLTTSCSKDEEEPREPQLEVNYNNISGDWQLIRWDDHALADSAYLYISFDRRKHTFVMHDRLSSMYDHTTTGTYTLTLDEETNLTTLSGEYDHGVGEWNKQYTVSSLTAKEMLLTSQTEPAETQLFRRKE